MGTPAPLFKHYTKHVIVGRDIRRGLSAKSFCKTLLSAHLSRNVSTIIWIYLLSLLGKEPIGNIKKGWAKLLGNQMCLSSSMLPQRRAVSLFFRPAVIHFNNMNLFNLHRSRCALRNAYSAVLSSFVYIISEKGIKNQKRWL